MNQSIRLSLLLAAAIAGMVFIWVTQAPSSQITMDNPSVPSSININNS